MRVSNRESIVDVEYSSRSVTSRARQFVHETCLNEWIAARGSDPNPKCEVCHTPLAFTKGEIQRSQSFEPNLR